MITEDLIAYIQAQLRKNISRDIIISRLEDAGWHSDDVAEAFRKIAPPIPVAPRVTPIEQPIQTSMPVTPAQTVSERKDDPYHEKIGAGEPEAMTAKVWTPRATTTASPAFIPQSSEQAPIVKKEIQEPVNRVESVLTETLHPVFSSSFSEANPKIASVEPIKQTAPVVPIAVPELKLEPESAIDIYKEELMPVLISKDKSQVHMDMSAISMAQALAPGIAPKVFETPHVADSKLIPKDVMAPQVPVIPEVMPQAQAQASLSSTLSGFKMTTPVASSDIPESRGVPSGAMLHSYQRALMSAGRAEGDSLRKKRSTIVKWLIIILVVSALCGSAVAVMGNYISLPSFKFSIIKKDPKTLLIQAPLVLGTLKAYKIKTTATVSLPPLADITSGLVSGQVVQSTEKDTLSMHAEGLINHDIGQSPVVDYKATFHSSLFKNDLVTSVKYNDIVSLVTTPDLTELLGSNSPHVSNVLVPQDQLYTFTSLFPDSLKSKVEKVDIDKLFSVGVPSYITNETSVIFKSFVNSSTVLEKDPETIEGVLSYHYELTADKAASSHFISAFINVFTTGLSNEDKATLDERLGAVTIDSLSVWVGEEDNKIHQYAFTLSTPLSRLIGLEDKGIAGNIVNLDWKTTYSDFDIHNTIVMPTDAVTVADFMKEVSDMKIKDKLYSFKDLASSFRNATGNYGKRSNPTGSCTNPNPSSLFSPVGHTKGAATAVGDIASLMNDILNTTDGALACYSTTDAWALAAPIQAIGGSSYCVDSTGAKKVLATGLAGPVCK